MFCGKCGNEIKNGGRFCIKCGAEIAGHTTEPQVHTYRREKPGTARTIIAGVLGIALPCLVYYLNGWIAKWAAARYMGYEAGEKFRVSVISIMIVLLVQEVTLTILILVGRKVKILWSSGIVLVCCTIWYFLVQPGLFMLGDMNLIVSVSYMRISGMAGLLLGFACVVLGCRRWGCLFTLVAMTADIAVVAAGTFVSIAYFHYGLSSPGIVQIAVSVFILVFSILLECLGRKNSTGKNIQK